MSWTSAPPACSTGKAPDRQAMLLPEKAPRAGASAQPQRGGQGRGVLHGEEDTRIWSCHLKITGLASNFLVSVSPSEKRGKH